MKWPVVLIGVVLVAAVLIFAISYGPPDPSNIASSSSSSEISIIPNIASVAYTDTRHGFSIMYPVTASTTGSGFDGFLHIAKEPLVGIYLPPSYFKGTDLIEAGVFIGQANDAESLNACTEPADGEEPLGSRQTGNATFQVFASTGAAAGNMYDETIYRAMRNGDCFEIAEMMHSGNIGNYPNNSVKQFDQDAMRRILDSLVGTFAFIGKSGSGVEGKLQISCADQNSCESPAQTIEAYQGISPVALFKSASDGSFSAELPPGQYELRVDSASSTHCASVGIVVTDNAYISTDISCEAGMQE